MEEKLNGNSKKRGLDFSDIKLFSTDNPEENLLLTDAAQEVLAKGYLPINIKTAIDRIVGKQGYVQLKACDIITEIYTYLSEGVITQDKLHQPNRTIALLAMMPNDNSSIRQKNEKMRKKLDCECCQVNKKNCFVTVCGHFVCDMCFQNKGKCPVCTKGKEHDFIVIKTS